MAVTFTRAPTVATGDRITSSQFAQLAAAFNDRLKSGLGDPTFRLFFYLLSLCRQIRNPGEGFFAFPPNHEFFTIYQHLKPEDVQWPLSGPGDFEGANVAAFINAYVFGASAINLNDENTRFYDLPWLIEEPDDETAWTLAKLQRGAYDPNTRGLASPAFTLAREHWKIRASLTSPHGNAYGGYLPTPPVDSSSCVDPEITNYQPFFTSLVDGSTATFSGSCPEEPTHVGGIAYLPWAYIVFQYDGTATILPFTEWIEGPYTGEAYLRKTASQGIPRVLNAFVSEFRGTAEDRRNQSYHLGNAFDFQRFFASQYHLSPSIGTETAGSIQPSYPTVQLRDNAPSGAVVPFTGDGNVHEWAEGFVCASALIVADDLASAVTIELWDDGTMVESKIITPDENGSVRQIWMMTTPAWRPKMKVVLGTSLTLRDTGNAQLLIEFTELYAYKPGIHDAFVLCRAAFASQGAPDGVGLYETQATELSDSYFAKGCIWNISGQPETQPAWAEVNQNAVFDVFRRLSQVVRVIRREEMVGYEVSGGKSILYFRRHVMGLAGSAPADAWGGIGPDRDRIPSGEIRRGRRYLVRTGNIRYQDRVYQAGEEFVGVLGATTYEGGTELYDADGIRLVAPPQDYSNRWVLGVETRPYHPSESSIWKPGAFTDYWSTLNRCHFYGPEVGGDRMLLNHMAFGNHAGGYVITPESPSGYNYAEMGVTVGGISNANTTLCFGDPTCEAYRANFYRSCRIYEPDIEIESVEWDSGTTHDEVLRVTLTGRLHHCDSADSVIPRDVASWDLITLGNEEYRTAENGIRDYLVHQTNGTHCQVRIGDEAINGVASGLPDNPFGSCYPTLRLTKLIPEPYDDGNDAQNVHDTRFEHDAFRVMELYLRAMCEGYVDGETTASYACEHSTSSTFDFSFENLCLQAFGNRWMTTIPQDVSGGENQQGFGPLPNTDAMASQFNELSSAVNLLTTVRVMVPAIPQMRRNRGERYDPVGAVDATGGGVPCDGTSEVWLTAGSGSVAPDPSLGTWMDTVGEGVESSSWLNGDCDGSNWVLYTYREAVEFRWNLENSDITEAFPETWRSLFNDSPSFMMRMTRRDVTWTRFSTMDIGEREECNGDTWQIAPGGPWLGWRPTTVETVTCQSFTGRLESPGLTVHDTWHGWDITICDGNGQSRGVTADILAFDTPTLTVPFA